MSEHNYDVTVTWTGNRGLGTSGYRVYERSHTISAAKKVDIHCSSDPAFRGDSSKYNPEDLLLASVASCHMLWYLHLCEEAGIVVVKYNDKAKGVMLESANDAGGRFTGIVLYPEVTINDASQIDAAQELHNKAKELCFIGNSCNFPIEHQATCNANA